MITLKTLHLATAQEVFDQAAKHLLTQKRQSKKTDVDEECLYRGPKGLQCAAGCFIAEDEYHAEMEGIPWDSLEDFYVNNPEIEKPQSFEPAFLEIHRSLIKALQKLHDDNPPKEWKSKLIELARRYNLEFKEL